MKELLDSISKLIEALDKYKVGAILLLTSVISAFIIYIAIYTPITSVTQTNSVSIPTVLAKDLDYILAQIATDLDADLTAIGLYIYDPVYEELYISFLRQHTEPTIYPIPNARYYLAYNNLYERYKKHKAGECYIRSFENTNTKVAISCPFFDKNKKLIGFLTVEYINSEPKDLDYKKLLTAKKIYSIESTLKNYTDSIIKKEIAPSN